MKIFLLTVVLLTGSPFSASAQQKLADAANILFGEQVEQGVSIGLQLNQYQNDFGTGLTLTSPFIANHKLALRLRGNLMFHQHASGGETIWTPYANLSAGLIGVSGIINNRIKLYGEGGVISLIPSEEFSSDSFKLGGYGLFGFEFYMTRRNNYFIEIGGIGTGAKADQVPLSPIYSNGLLISTGFRVHL